MRKVYGIHKVELTPGTSEEEFEAFARQTDWRLPGLRAYVVKGARGEKVGQYACVVDFDSAERYYELFPEMGVPNDEMREYLESERVKQAFKRWNELATPLGTHVTDYIMIDDRGF